jgi:hypothetical protein
MNKKNMDFGQKVSAMLKRFGTWVMNLIHKIPEIFSRNFSAQINYVEKNAELNKEISGAIGQTFKPKVENFPKFEIKLNDITNHANSIPDKLKKYYDENSKFITTPDINTLRSEIYPPEVTKGMPMFNDAKPFVSSEGYIPEKDIIDYWTMEQDDGQNEKESDPNVDKLKKRLTEYFLFGNVTENGLDDSSHYTNELDSKTWDDMCNNILNTKKAIEVGISGMGKALSNASKQMQQRIEKLENQNKEQSSSSDGTNSGGNTSETDDKIKKCGDVAKYLMIISNEYVVGFANTMQEMFFKKSYNLYKDIVTEYKNMKGTFNQQQPTANQNNQQANVNNNADAKTPVSPETPIGGT